MSEKDYYGGHASDYAKYRPTYPEALFQQLLKLVPDYELAWDCGTGNGQVAVRLAEDFEKVWATDMSQLQLDEAAQSARVTYHCNEAHESGLEDNSVSLVTVGTAVHWFEQEKFYAEALRVLKPGGILAVWSYGADLVKPDEAADIVRKFATETLAGDWPKGIEWVADRYETLPFPLDDLTLEPIDFHLNWSLKDLLCWIDTWSAVRRYRKRTTEDPMIGLPKELESVWPLSEDETTQVVFPLYLRVGRVA